MSSRLFWLVLLLFTLLGCKTIETSVENYKQCINDPTCANEVVAVRTGAYNLTKNTLHSTAFPSFSEAVALILSNVVAFGVGVVKGSKKKG